MATSEHLAMEFGRRELWGPGYRIYYAQADLKIILLLLGGDKRKQVSDIQLAKDYLTDWQLRNKHK